MRIVTLFVFTLITSFTTTELAFAGSKWLRLSWQGNASTEAIISYTPDGNNSNAFIKYGVFNIDV